MQCFMKKISGFDGNYGSYGQAVKLFKRHPTKPSGRILFLFSLLMISFMIPYFLLLAMMTIYDEVCVCLCVTRKMITSSMESHVATRNHSV